MMKNTLKYGKLDKKLGIISLYRGTSKEGRSFYAYIDVLPSKFHEYRDKKPGEHMDLSLYGSILFAGWGENPEAEVKKRMEETFGVDHEFETTLIQKLIKIKEEMENE